MSYINFCALYKLNYLLTYLLSMWYIKYCLQSTGVDGAAIIGRLLTERGIHFEFILDEGTIILDGSSLGTKKPVAL